MCGVAGLHTPGRRVDHATLDGMLAEMVHRGPDGSGSWVHEDVALGMRRLAIVDVEGGRQPLTNEDQSISVVFNGEIYNHGALRPDLAARGHRFGSDTDGEVIPLDPHVLQPLQPSNVDQHGGHGETQL